MSEFKVVNPSFFKTILVIHRNNFIFLVLMSLVIFAFIFNGPGVPSLMTRDLIVLIVSLALWSLALISLLFSGIKNHSLMFFFDGDYLQVIKNNIIIHKIEKNKLALIEYNSKSLKLIFSVNKKMKDFFLIMDQDSNQLKSFQKSRLEGGNLGLVDFWDYLRKSYFPNLMMNISKYLFAFFFTIVFLKGLDRYSSSGYTLTLDYLYYISLVPINLFSLTIIIMFIKYKKGLYEHMKTR